MAKLELIHLNKTYTSKVIPVKDLSLSVEDGEFLTLLGPSGMRQVYDFADDCRAGAADAR